MNSLPPVFEESAAEAAPKAAPRPRLSLQVVKIGGSLLDAPGWRERLADWWRRPAPRLRILVAGGGELVDVLRKRHAEQGLSEEVSHRLALQAMQVNASFLWESLPAARRLGLAELRRMMERRTRGAEDDCDLPWVLEPWPLLDDPTWFSPLGPVPQTWDSTSDALAAWLAGVLSADELVLLKSCLPAAGATRASAAAEGYVDASFPRFAAALPRVRAVDLSSSAAPFALLGL